MNNNRDKEEYAELMQYMRFYWNIYCLYFQGSFKHNSCKKTISAVWPNTTLLWTNKEYRPLQFQCEMTFFRSAFFHIFKFKYNPLQQQVFFHW